MPLPFDGKITEFYQEHAPKEVRDAILSKDKKDILDPAFPYAKVMGNKSYLKEMAQLQIELAKFQSWLKSSETRVAIVFEGRDAAGKGGTIKRFRENLNPRVARVVALSKPSDREAAQWYFQRYIAHLPARGEMTLFDRSWYNRAVVEHVFGFCTQEQRQKFFDQTPDFEKMLKDEGIHLIKFWLNVGRAEQLRRFLARESDPLKQWKLSWIDVDGLARWDAYSDAIKEMFEHTHSAHSPWTIIRSDDKKRARLNAIRHVLLQFDYDGRDLGAIGESDPLICGTPEVWHA
jgi:polyphosphate kinase 2